MQQQKLAKEPAMKVGHAEAQPPTVQQESLQRSTPTSLPPPPNAPQPHLQRRVVDVRTLTPNQVIHLQGTIGNHAVQRLLNQHNQARVDVARPGAPLIQPALKVGPAHDHFEQEADRVAQQVIQKKSVIQRVSKNSSRESFATSPAFEEQLSRTKGSGRALSPKTRTDFESSFGASFGNVRIHTGADAKQLNHSIQAKAFTHGNDIHFGTGEYNPSSSQGRQLLAHELTHTIQQGAATPLQREPAAPVQESVKPRVIARAPALTVQRKIGFTSDRLGSTSLKAKANGMKGDQSTLSLLKEKLDQYHRAQGPADELEFLTQIKELAGMWLTNHGNNDKKSPGLINLRDLVELEIPKVKRLIPGGPEEHDEYIRTIESKSLRFITNQGVDIAKNMKEWHSGVENQGEQDEQKKARAERARATITKNKLTLAEATGIGIFTADDYRYINPALLQDKKWMQGSLPKADVADKNLKDKLRGKIDDESMQGAMAEGILHNKMALSGFKKLPNWKGITYRGEAYPMQEFSEKYTVGGTRVFDTMSSSSENTDAANSFILGEATPEKEPIFLTLELKTGKDIQALAHNPKEGEITIMPGTRFKVKSIKQSPMSKSRMQHNVRLVEM